MADVSSPNKRQFARNVSNVSHMKQSDLQTPTKLPCTDFSTASAVASPGAVGCWTSADQFKFVEEDDDEVLFRVRDSGVLRSLALPGLSKIAAISSDESLEEKQV